MNQMIDFKATPLTAKNTGIRLSKAPGQKPRLVAQARPTPKAGELLIRVATVAMCRTDLLVADGRLPVERELTLGHEVSGWVEASGDAEIDTENGLAKNGAKTGQNAARAFAPGALVCVNPTFDLPSGRDGFMGVDADGALGTWIVAPREKCHAAGGLDPRQAAYLEPIAAAMGGLDAAREVGGRGAIIGANRIADLTGAIFSHPGATSEKDGDTDGKNTQSAQSVPHDRITMEQLKAAPANHYDWLLESRMSEELMVEAARVLKPGGRLIMKSRHMDAVNFPVRDFVLKRLSLVGRTRSDFEGAMAWLNDNADFVETLLGDSYPLADWEAAFAAAESGEGKKVFVTVSEA